MQQLLNVRPQPTSANAKPQPSLDPPWGRVYIGFIVGTK